MRLALLGLLTAALALTASTLASSAACDPPSLSLTGSYIITNIDGTPVVPGATAAVDVNPIPFTYCYSGVVTLDRGDGSGPQQLDTLMICPDGHLWVFHNEAGNTGELRSIDPPGTHESTMTSGPNTGAQRHWTRQ